MIILNKSQSIAVGLACILAGCAFAKTPIKSTAKHSKQMISKKSSSKKIIKINLNKTDAKTLAKAKIKGIGPKRAVRIITYRKKQGRFKKLDDLVNIKGLSQRFIDKNRVYLKRRLSL